MAVAKRKAAKKPVVKKPTTTSKVKKVASKISKPRKTTVTQKKAEAPKLAKISPPSKPYKLSEFIQCLVDTGITRKQAKTVYEQLTNVIGAHLGKGGPGVFVLPRLLKILVQTKPATKARKGVNPFTGEEQMFKAKPARKVVKIRPLKQLKSMA
ncbi:MAG: histone-like DNA-binding protein [Francisellaceae bacterium]|nr:histone-like DNA-binding protein [Francisellaceae bacterium]